MVQETTALSANISDTTPLSWATIAANTTENFLNFINPIAAAQAATKPTDFTTPYPLLEPNQVQKFSIPAADKVAFVGGLFDGWTGVVNSEAISYAAAHPGQSKYFSCTDGPALANYIAASGGHVVIIAHSYGADTAAARVAASGLQVDGLITLDPVSLFNPSYATVAAHAKVWYDLNAAGGGVTAPSNIIAGAGGDWGQPVAKYATYYANVDINHANIGGTIMVPYIIGN